MRQLFKRVAVASAIVFTTLSLLVSCAENVNRSAVPPLVSVAASAWIVGVSVIALLIGAWRSAGEILSSRNEQHRPSRRTAADDWESDPHNPANY